MSLWSELSVDLLRTIEEQLNQCPDKIRFRCVCTHWQSSSPELLNLRDPQLPLLLIPYKNGSMCGLYHPFEKKVFNINLPEAGEKVFKGSGHGWVVTAQLYGSINVVNPLSRVVVQLPPRTKFPDVLDYRADMVDDEYLIVNEKSWYNDENALPYTIDSAHMKNYHLNKIVLSCSPTCKDFRAVARYRYCRLAYCKVGDDEWRDLVDVRDCNCEDVTFVGAKLYVLSWNGGRGDIYVCDDIVSCPELRKCVALPNFEDVSCDVDHLINLSDNSVIIVRRNRGYRDFVRRDEGYHEINSSETDDYGYGDDRELLSFTSDFEIFKPDMSSSSWVSTKSLGDEILFMGLGTQMGISSQNFRGSVGNQIYFATSDLNFRVEDVEDCFDDGVFNFEDKEFKSLDYVCDSKVIWPQPIWFTPNPY